METTHHQYNKDLIILEAAILKILRMRHADTSLDLVRSALNIAITWHGDDVRVSGEPVVSHSMRVAAGLAALGYGEKVVATGLLHNVLDDTGLSLSTLGALVEPEVAHLVSVLTKDEGLEKASREPAAMLTLARQMLMHPCLFTIKVLDHMDNLTSLNVFRRDEQQRIVEATQRYFSPALEAANLESLRSWILHPPCIQQPLEFIHEVSTQMTAWPAIFYDLALSDDQVGRDPILRSVSHALEMAVINHV